MQDVVLKGLGLGFLLAISVGPVIFSIIKQSINNGFKGGLAFILGVAFSDLALVLVSNVFTEMFARLLRFERIIGMGGAVLLIVFGLYFLFFKKVQPAPDGGTLHHQLKAADYVKIFFAGYFINTLNPGVIAFWFSWATAFAAITLKDRLVLFATCLAVVFAADLLKVLLAGRLRSRLTVKVIHRINQLSGIILVVFGVVLLAGLLMYRTNTS